MTIGASQLGRLTAGKAAANTSLRWIPFFLPTLAVAFNASTSTLAAFLGLAEASGLTTLVAGRWLDAGRERFVIVVALVGIAIASLIALVGSIPAFAVMAVLLGSAAGYVTVGGHAWISARVPFDRRARFIGIYEMSWASALLIGAPLVALLISWGGWRAPFVALAAACALAAIGVATISEGERPQPVRQATFEGPLGADAWIVIGAGAATAMAGLTTIVVAGTWLDDELGVSTAGVGLVAMAFGAAELLASSSSSAFADKLGKRRSMQLALLAVLIGLAIISVAGSSLLVGAVGLLCFFVGFEYSIVTSFSLISEALPQARGRAIGIGNAVGTLSRGVGVLSAGFLYERYGITGPAILSAIAAMFSIGFLVSIAHRRPELR